MYHATVALSDPGVKLGLRALNRVAWLELVDRLGLREPTERFLYRASSDTVRVAGRVGRRFSAVQKITLPARLATTRPADRFDLTPTDEQQMLRDSFRSFASERLRPAAER